MCPFQVLESRFSSIYTKTMEKAKIKEQVKEYWSKAKTRQLTKLTIAVGVLPYDSVLRQNNQHYLWLHFPLV